MIRTKLKAVQTLIKRRGTQQFLIRPHSYDTTGIHDDDLMSSEHRGKTMGDGDDRLTFGKAVDSILDNFYVSASLTTDEFKKLVEGIRFIETSLAHPMEKDSLASELDPLRQMFRQALVAAIDLPAGTIIDRSHLSCRKPCKGIPASDVQFVTGRKLKRAIKALQFLSLEDFE